jgi:hypothetical protein
MILTRRALSGIAKGSPYAGFARAAELVLA